MANWCTARHKVFNDPSHFAQVFTWSSVNPLPTAQVLHPVCIKHGDDRYVNFQRLKILQFGNILLRNTFSQIRKIVVTCELHEVLVYCKY